ncbi:MAG: DUF1640 domain-containing protein [Gammaproteobacteria bacterium]|nr:DUF1640 domain-containing protein [Gammaproteobacteria bacterium]
MEFYEQLASAPDDKTRARLIAEAFERVEERYPEVKELATQSGLRDTELRLQKEIAQVRAEMREMDGRLTKEIAQIRAEMHEMDGRLTKEIAQVRADMHEMDGRLTKEIAQVRADMHEMGGRLAKEIAQTKVDTIKWTAGMLVVQLGLFGALLKLLLP